MGLLLAFVGAFKGDALMVGHVGRIVKHHRLESSLANSAAKRSGILCSLLRPKSPRIAPQNLLMCSRRADTLLAQLVQEGLRVAKPAGPLPNGPFALRVSLPKTTLVAIKELAARILQQLAEDALKEPGDGTT